MNTSYRKIAAYLMLLSGLTHPAQMLVYGTAPEIRGPAISGMIFLVVGAALLTPWRSVLWVAIALPLAGGLGAAFRIVADVPTAFTYFHALIDFAVVGLAGASLSDGHPTLGRWLRRAAIALVAVAGGGFALLFSALQDNPARPSVGELRVATGGDADLEYYAGGPTTGLVVVLVPSFARSASDFNELVTHLNRNGYRTLAVQPRGVEGSELPSMQGTLHTYAADVEQVLNAEAAGEPVVVLGHAYGNRVARTFASDFPERTRALILLAAGGEAPTPPETGNAILLAMVKIVPEARRREAVQLAFFAKGNPVADYWIRGWYPRAGLAEQMASAATPYSEWGAGGEAPILVLDAQEDTEAAHGGAQLQDQFPNRVQLREIPNAGHALLNERPKRIRDEVIDYLATLPSPDGGLEEATDSGSSEAFFAEARNRAQAPATSLAQIQRVLVPHIRVYRPEGPGPFPGVILLHGCSGPTPSHEADWAHFYAERGVVTLAVDSLGPRQLDWERVCNLETLTGRERAADILAALEHARSLAFVDPERLALTGFSHGAWTIWEFLLLASNRTPPLGLEAWPEGGAEGVSAAFLFYGPVSRELHPPHPHPRLPRGERPLHRRGHVP